MFGTGYFVQLISCRMKLIKSCLPIRLKYQLLFLVLLSLPVLIFVSRGVFQRDLPNPSKPTYVLIVAYFRSGSTFTSSVIDQYPGTFYKFEPMYRFRSDYNMTFMNGTKLYLATDSQVVLESVRQIQKWFECDLKEICTDSLTMLHRTTKNKPYAVCVDRYLRRKRGLDVCVAILRNMCENSSVRLIKIIRLNVKQTRVFLENNTNLRLIYLVRDPRGILHSRKIVGETPEFYNKIGDYAKELCESMEADIRDFNIIKQNFPDRAAMIRYETLAMNPLKKVKELYKFVGVPLTLDNIRRVYRKSVLGKKGGYFDSDREDSRTVPYKWFETADPQIIIKIDKFCRNVYNKLGYFMFDSEQYIQSKSFINQSFVP